MGLLALYFFGALGISFVCSLLESVILSVSHAHIAVMVKEGKSAGRLLRDLKRDIEHPLAAILTLNTVANTLGAAGVGAQAYRVLGSTWVAISSGMLTLCILVFSEIIPKTLGATYWKRLSPITAYLLRVMIVLLYPVVRALEAVSHLIGARRDHSRITREELLVLAEIAEHDGALLHEETRIIRNLLLLREVSARDVLTPRSVMLAFDAGETVGAVMAEHAPLRFSRIPVFGENRDDIRGVVFRTDLMEAMHDDRRDEPVGSLVQSLHAVPDTKPIADLLDEFIARREHMFLVVDEYGGTAGIVTLEDAIESLLGVEIVDELDSVVDMRAYALERWKRIRRGRTL